MLVTGKDMQGAIPAAIAVDENMLGKIAKAGAHVEDEGVAVGGEDFDAVVSPP